MTLISAILTALVATQLTFWLTHQKKMSPIRSTSLLTLLFVGLTYLFPNIFPPALQAVFFVGTFVGMSEPSRLSEKKVLCAGILSGILFYYLKQTELGHFRGGIGGTVGGTAFVSCLIVYWLQLGVAQFLRLKKASLS
jgi:hypothetical protein